MHWNTNSARRFSPWLRPAFSLFGRPPHRIYPFPWAAAVVPLALQASSAVPTRLSMREFDPLEQVPRIGCKGIS